MNAKHIHSDNIFSIRAKAFVPSLSIELCDITARARHVSPLRAQQKVRAVFVEDDNIVVVGTLAFHVLLVEMGIDTFVVRFLSPKRISNESPWRTV